MCDPPPMDALTLPRYSSHSPPPYPQDVYEHGCVEISCHRNDQDRTQV